MGRLEFEASPKKENRAVIALRLGETLAQDHHEQGKR